MTKVYAVTFMNYTDWTKDTVSNGEEEIGKVKYIHIGEDPFLILENDIEHYQKFGGGIRDMVFVGNIDK